MIPGAKLLADFGEDLLGGAGSPGVHIVQPLANRPEGVLTFGVGLVLVLPPGQNLIQGDISASPLVSLAWAKSRKARRSFARSVAMLLKTPVVLAYQHRGIWAASMKQLDDDVVSASEIAQWAWCPESWRLDSLGFEPGNRAALEKGESDPRANGDFRGVVAVGDFGRLVARRARPSSGPAGPHPGEGLMVWLLAVPSSWAFWGSSWSCSQREGERREGSARARPSPSMT